MMKDELLINACKSSILDEEDSENICSDYSQDDKSNSS
jgi:hypothetical protein